MGDKLCLKLNFAIFVTVTMASMTAGNSSDSKLAAKSSNILVFHNIGTKSQLYTMFPIVEKLLERGHKVTGIYFASTKIQHENYTEIIIPDLQVEYFKVLSQVYLEEGVQVGIANLNVLLKTRPLQATILEDTNEVLRGLDMQALAAQNFDTIITASMYGYYMAEVLDLPVVFMSPIGPFTTLLAETGNPFNPSYQAVVGHPLRDPADFSQRLGNVVQHSALKTLFFFYLKALSGKLEELGYQGPTFQELEEERTELMLFNSHFLIHKPQPYLGNIVEVGGVHIKEPKPLPKDLQSFLDSHPEGVVLVSFGSTISPSSMPEEKKQLFLKTFANLNVPIIWKWDNEDIEVADNILVKKWLPQQDLLAHPNLKVFVTHGGLLSLMEAIHFETVIVGIPFANDQLPNLQRAEDLNIGISLDWKSLTVEKLEGAIRKAFQDPEMKSSMAKSSRIFKDAKDKPIDRAVWSIEYSIRNKGSPLLRSDALKLNWYQYYLLDVLGLIAIILLVSVYISYRIAKCLISCCCGCCGKKTKTE